MLDWSRAEILELLDTASEIWTRTLADIANLAVVPGRSQAEVVEQVGLEFQAQPLASEELRGFLERFVENSGLPGHPAFLGYIVGAGTPAAAIADLLASALTPNVGGWQFSPGAHELERQLVDWFGGMLGLPEGRGGLVVGGGAIGNLVGLKLARDQQLGLTVRREGLRETASHIIYASDQAHDTIQRGADILGLGSSSVRVIASDSSGRMLIDELRGAIDRDIAVGTRPIAVVATAGTTGTGAVDPLEEIATVATEHGLWFHVDAAYGGGLALVPELREVLSGIERADSVIVDAHKWLYVSAPACLTLVRDAKHLTQSFAVAPAYVFEDAGRSGQGVNAAFISPTFSRAFDALKIILSLLAHGTDAYAARIRHDVRLSEYLAGRIEEEPDLELLIPPSLSVCCYRYRPPGVSMPPAGDDYLDELNERILVELQLGGRLFPSNATVQGRFALRTCIVNFRTEAAELDLLLEETRRIGERLHAELTAGRP